MPLGAMIPVNRPAFCLAWIAAISFSFAHFIGVSPFGGCIIAGLFALEVAATFLFLRHEMARALDIADYSDAESQG